MHLFVFIIKKFVTMHGHMNVKFFHTVLYDMLVIALNQDHFKIKTEIRECQEIRGLRCVNYAFIVYSLSVPRIEMFSPINVCPTSGSTVVLIHTL